MFVHVQYNIDTFIVSGIQIQKMYYYLSVSETGLLGLRKIILEHPKNIQSTHLEREIITYKR